VALLRAANHYYQQIDSAKRELDSRKVPLVEGLEAANEKPRSQRQYAGSDAILNIFLRKKILFIAKFEKQALLAAYLAKPRSGRGI
jgi:hypothetical protein